MKLAYVVSALSLLPASAAFVPHASSRASLQTKTSSSLNGFFENLFGDRSGTEEEEAKAIVKSVKKLNLKDLIKAIKATKAWKLEQEENKIRWGKPTFKHLPTKSQTGVDVDIARYAATLSSQLYDVTDGTLDNFMLSTDEFPVDMVINDLKGVFQSTNPPFAAIVCRDTMIIGWRGSSTPTDYMNDFAWSPCSNLALGKHAKNIKLQGGMTSLCLNDIVTHQDVLIAECKKRGIKEIVTTGHSLGGGIAQIGHTILRAQVQNENSPWFELKDLDIRSLGFSGPMTTQIVKDDCSDETLKFIEEVNDNSCMVVYHNDVVPRCYGYGSYMSACLNDCAAGVGVYMSNGKYKVIIYKLATIAEQFVSGTDEVKDIVKVWSKYTHPGTIVSYNDYNAKSQTLVDYGAFHKNSGKMNTFRSVKYEPVKKGENACDDLEDNHLAPIRGMEYNLNNMN